MRARLTGKRVINDKSDPVLSECRDELGLDGASNPVVHGLVYSGEDVAFGFASTYNFCDLYNKCQEQKSCEEAGPTHLPSSKI